MNKFNPHILLVMRWLQDNDLVSVKELEANANAIDDADAAYVANAAIYYAVSSASAAAYTAADADAYIVAYAANDTKYWLDRYFEITKENRQVYENRAKHLNILGVKNE